ncbi:MAG: 3-dehydroquinate synthase [Bacteroidota bacterium]|jgi:3-dehydroquinate synthase
MMPLKPADVQFTENPASDIRSILNTRTSVLLCDEHTLTHCAPLLGNQFTHTLVIKPGEAEKTLETAALIWKHLLAWNVKRSDVMVCLGGGVITDLGAFCASVFQRGISYVLVPTTLLAMTDAAIGGKTGVNFQYKKNYLGTFSGPEAILVYPDFLKTLDPQTLNEGWAEMLKHGLIADQELYRQIACLGHLHRIPEVELLQRSIAVKSDIVAADMFDLNQRKLLNFGHTLGHALETWYLERNRPLAHGLAVAAGMWMECHLSMQLGWLTNIDCTQIQALIDKFFNPVMFSTDGIAEIAAFCHYDKKNIDQQLVNITVLCAAGAARVDGNVNNTQLNNALSAYLECHRG